MRRKSQLTLQPTIKEMLLHLKVGEKEEAVPLKVAKESEHYPSTNGWFAYDPHKIRISNIDAAEVHEIANTLLRRHLIEYSERGIRASRQIILKAFVEATKADTSFSPTIIDPDLPGQHAGIVYLIQAGTHYKIGKTTDIDARIAQLRIQLPYKPRVIHIIHTKKVYGNSLGR